MDAIIKLYDADTFEYRGMILVCGKMWEYREMNDDYLQTVTLGMPLKAVLASLISFNIVYEIEGHDLDMNDAEATEYFL